MVGFLGHHINRDEDDPNMVSAYFALSDLDKAKKFAASEDLQEVMQDAGVTGLPEMMWLKPARESIV